LKYNRVSVSGVRCAESEFPFVVYTKNYSERTNLIAKQRKHSVTNFR